MKTMKVKFRTYLTVPILTAVFLSIPSGMLPQQAKRLSAASFRISVQGGIPSDALCAVFPDAGAPLGALSSSGALSLADSISLSGIGVRERTVLQDSYMDGWLDTPYGGPENALKVPAGGIPAILLLLVMAYGIVKRKTPAGLHKPFLRM
jgi:hypothetical protein